MFGLYDDETSLAPGPSGVLRVVLDDVAVAGLHDGYHIIFMSDHVDKGQVAVA